MNDTAERDVLVQGSDSRFFRCFTLTLSAGIVIHCVVQTGKVIWQIIRTLLDWITRKYCFEGFTH